MPLLRLIEKSEGGDSYQIRLEIEIKGQRRTEERKFSFKLEGRDQEDFRWYLEDYLQYPLDPAPTIAKRIVARMEEIGEDLFRKVLEHTEAWAEVRHHLSDTRFEITTGVPEATAIPWELLRDPQSGVPLALQARAFVRATENAVQRASLPETATGPVRVLLVICRPRGRDDVPFRSVARRLVEGLRQSEDVKLKVLRPPTFENLSRELFDAKDRGEPVHLVHFDGHGVWSEHGPRNGGHGYVLFENPALDENQELVDGPKLGSLLGETGVAALVLNACQSAYATPLEKPAPAPENVHEETRALGSLAQEVMDAGAAGVVAMRYSVFVETAARFVTDLYSRLLDGDTLGQAVTFGRKQLHAQPLRGIGFDPIPLRDWSVPVVFEAAPLALFPKRTESTTLKFSAGATAMEGLPPRPDAGFFGRDETLLALDRAFDRQSIALLHAYAGGGKTTAAAEFARWYRETGGVEGAVLFTSFEQHKPLARALDQVGQAFGQALEKAGVNWLALSDSQRREVALQVLKQIPVLWIWDNVESVAGFPSGTESMWTPAEQKELADFLRAARETKAKFLLTSRRDERGWLGDLPVRVALPPMAFQERLELARALAEKLNRRLTDVADWRPLLDFTQGNPLAITVLVGQALRDGLRTREQIEAFVARLRTGEAKFADEASEGRTRSLAASLGYGFEHAFNDAERKQLALLHLFQGFVQVAALRLMEGLTLTREDGSRLLDRAAEVGLLTAHGGGYYSIHPALPWFFRKLFEDQDAEERERALWNYAEAFRSLGDFCLSEYERGNRDVIDVLRAEESNLLHARSVARRKGWWPQVVSTMQGLRELYGHSGRQVEWRRLVEEIVPEFVDSATNGPLPGREDHWGVVSDFRVRLLHESRQWAAAERLQKDSMDWRKQRTQNDDPDGLGILSTSLHELGEIQREMGRPECVEAYREAFDLAQRIGERPTAAVVAFNLGNAYMDLIRDLDEAERWYRRSLELTTEGDRLYRASSLGQLAAVAFERFREARNANQPEAELLQLLNKVLELYCQVLEMTPPDAVGQLAISQNNLGLAYEAAGKLDRTLYHYREAIQLFGSVGDLYRAARTQYNVAIALLGERRLPDAREYALAALRNFQTYGAGAQEMIQKTLDLIALIDKAVAG
jgi:tetratricopeptide (TPR) repeat protein